MDDNIWRNVQERLSAAFDTATVPETPAVGYVRAKARLFRKIGADAYRAADVFEQPDIRLSQENLTAIERGVDEIIEGKGFSTSTPLTHLPAEFSHSLANLFHFQVVAQRATRSEDGLYFIDALLSRHLIDDRELVLFNRVPTGRGRKTMEDMP